MLSNQNYLQNIILSIDGLINRYNLKQPLNVMYSFSVAEPWRVNKHKLMGSLKVQNSSLPGFVQLLYFHKPTHTPGHSAEDPTCITRFTSV